MQLALANSQPPYFLKLLAHDIRWKLLVLLARSDYRVQELVHFIAQPQNLVSYHLRQLRAHNLVSERRSTADSRDVYLPKQLERKRNNLRSIARFVMN